MARKKQQEDVQEEEILQPVTVEVVQSAPEKTIPQGHVLLAALDADGNEVHDFTVTERGWKKTYADETKFRFKKKAK